jgi:hypothetical protein
MLQQHIEKTVEYITVRGVDKFDTLNLDEGNSYVESERTEVDPKVRGSLRSVGVKVQTTYSVRFHIVGAEKPGTRDKSIDIKEFRKYTEAQYKQWGVEPDPASYTIRQAIDNTIAWHQIYWAKKGYALRLDAVVRHTTYWVKINDFQQRCLSETLDIFRFPLTYTYQGNAIDPQLNGELETDEDHARSMTEE